MKVFYLDRQAVLDRVREQELETMRAEDNALVRRALAEGIELYASGTV